MTLPENRKPPAGTGGGSENDLLTGEIHFQHTELAELVAETEAALVGTLLKSDAESVRELAGGTSAAILADVRYQFVWNAARLCADDLVDPIPLAVVDAARRAGLEVPVGFRGHVLSELWALHTAAPAPASAGWLLSQVRANYARRLAAGALAVASDAVWRGDLADLRHVVAEQLGLALAELDSAASL
ncbi:hypothetical protein SAMN04515671_0092 [Nakamurella panacisegetis]|uniref:DnaB-like helicase N terminal domain-containing protein n=1 Tax=Nakamurella panacisegetis TaxID=1090615 RepID=A0A1H0HJ08_9ACTN|nr:hypothetical protein [Nakamurella panacisegetis]SDO19162.1 hypothetical protein SAMN04515671_0092 [Nakamurella panacisegetis]